MRPLSLVLCLSLTALPVFAGAPASGPVGEVAQLQSEFRDERARARRLRAEAAEAAVEIAGLERRLTPLRGEAEAGDAALVSQRARLRELNSREAALAARLSQARAGQGRLLSALQMMSRRPPPPLLVPAERAVDTVRAALLMQAIAPGLQARTQGLVDRQAELTRLRRSTALSSERLFTAESDQADRLAGIEALSARKTALQSVLRAEALGAERAARALEARLRTLGGGVPSRDDETEPASARLPAGRLRLTPPLEGAPSRRFGSDSSGWRWRADRAEARAPADGRVAWTGPMSGWGQVVILDLGPGWRAVIAGLDEVTVQTGARVADGQTLGRSGADGELSFELRRDERPVDPGPWLR